MFLRVTLLLCALALQCLPVSLYASKTVIKEIDLHVGQVKTINVGSVTRVAVGIDSILATSILDTGELLLIPSAPGETDVYVWKKGERLEVFRVRISSTNTTYSLEVLRDVLREFPGVKVRVAGGYFIVEGLVDSARLDSFNTVLGMFPGVISMVQPDDVIMRDMIKFDVQILEVNKNYLKDIGISWDRVIAGPHISHVSQFETNGHYVSYDQDNEFANTIYGDSPPAVGVDHTNSINFFGLATSISSKINLLKSDGVARTLAEPHLSARSGGSANFHSGGSYPVAVLNEFGQPIVDMVDYGIQLEIEPVSDRYGNIASSVSAEMSSLDFSNVVNGVPGLLTRKTESVINLKSGETMVISGLVHATDSQSVEKVPFLGDIPILGDLFRSKKFNEQRTELVILVTPRIVKPENDLVPERLKKHIGSLKKILSSTAIEEQLLD